MIQFIKWLHTIVTCDTCWNQSEHRSNYYKTKYFECLYGRIFPAYQNEPCMNYYDGFVLEGRVSYK